MNLGKDFQDYAIKHRGINSNTLHAVGNSLTPYIMEERELHVTQVDVFSRLMMERIIFLGSPIEDRIANVITAQLLYMDSISDQMPIKIYINSPGGDVYAGLGIYDTMQLVKPEVQTICTGLAASMGAVLLTAGAEGKRYALPHSRIMIHQVLGGTSGQATEVQIYLKEMLAVGDDLFQILAKHSGNTLEVIKNWCDRDHWMKAKEAKERRFIDNVLGAKKK